MVSFLRSSVYLTAVLVSTELWNLTCISLWNWRSSYLVDTLVMMTIMVVMMMTMMTVTVIIIKIMINSHV